MEFIELVEKRRDFLTEELASLKRKNRFPEGELVIQYGKRSNVYYWSKQTKNGVRRTHIKKADHELLDGLIRKRESEILMKRYTAELRAVRKLLSMYRRYFNERDQRFLDDLEMQTRLYQLNKAKGISYKKSLFETIRNWKNESYERDTNYPESLKHDAGDGLIVRSKSEVLIVTCLRKYKIPFRYEARLDIEVDGSMRPVYPDFTILHPYTGQIMYIEHFGMLGDAEYKEGIQWKLENYAKNGIYPFMNLVLLYESKEEPLSLARIEKTIVDNIVNIEVM